MTEVKLTKLDFAHTSQLAEVRPHIASHALLFLMARAEILTKNLLVFWSIWSHQKDISKLFDLYTFVSTKLLYGKLHMFFFLLLVTLNCGGSASENCTYFDSSTTVASGACKAKICRCSDDIWCVIKLIAFSSFMFGGVIFDILMDIFLMSSNQRK